MSSFMFDFEQSIDISNRITKTPLRLRTDFVAAFVANAPELKQYINALTTVILLYIVERTAPTQSQLADFYGEANSRPTRTPISCKVIKDFEKHTHHQAKYRLEAIKSAKEGQTGHLVGAPAGYWAHLVIEQNGVEVQEVQFRKSSKEVDSVEVLRSLPMIADQDNAALSDLLDLVGAKDE